MAILNINTTHAQSKNCLPSGVCFDQRVQLITEGIDGNFIEDGGISIDKQIISYYSKSTQKEADFLVLFKDWDAPAAAAFSILVNRNDSGMGMYKRADSKEQYGSKGNLKNFITMPNVKVLSFQYYPNDTNSFDAQIYIFAHEMGHQWLADFRNSQLIISNESGIHYDKCSVFNTADITDLMIDGFMNFQKVNDTTFASKIPDNNPYVKRFSNLSLYVMGLVPDTDVAPFQIIRDGTNRCSFDGKVENDVFTITGNAETITLSDLVKVYGARSPQFPNAQKEFTIQVALLVHKNSPLTQSDANTFTRYLDEVEKYLPFAFSNKATFTMVKTIPPPPASYITIVAPNGGENIRAGKSYPIKIETNLNGNYSVKIELLKFDGSVFNTKTLSNIVISTSSSHNINVPSNMPVGFYKLRLTVTSQTGQVYSDTSDNFFWIYKPFVNRIISSMYGAVLTPFEFIFGLFPH